MAATAAKLIGGDGRTGGNLFTSAAAPTVDNDVTTGYKVGDRMIDTTGAKEYVCLDATDGAAVWKEYTFAA